MKGCLVITFVNERSMKRDTSQKFKHSNFAAVVISNKQICESAQETICTSCSSSFTFFSFLWAFSGWTSSWATDTSTKPEEGPLGEGPVYATTYRAYAFNVFLCQQHCNSTLDQLEVVDHRMSLVDLLPNITQFTGKTTCNCSSCWCVTWMRFTRLLILIWSIVLLSFIKCIL